jgi:hypothetical protein
LQSQHEETILYPYASSTSRLGSEIITAFSESGGITKVGLAGPLAVSNHDGYDEIQTVVSTENPQFVVDLLDDLFPIRYYRQFSHMDQPSGRFWLHDESPFNFVALAFYSEAEFETAVNNGELAHGAPFREFPCTTEKKITSPRRYQFTDTSGESTFSKNIEPALDAIRSVMRGEGEMARVRDCVLELQSVQGQARSLSPALSALLQDVVQIGARLISIDIQTQKT